MGAGALPSFPRQALLSEASASPVTGRPLIPLLSPALRLSPPLILLSFEAGIWEQCLPCSLPPGWSRRQTIGVACCQGPGRGGSAQQHLPWAGGGTVLVVARGRAWCGSWCACMCTPRFLLRDGRSCHDPLWFVEKQLCANALEDACGNSNSLI